MLDEGNGNPIVLASTFPLCSWHIYDEALWNVNAGDETSTARKWDVVTVCWSDHSATLAPISKAFLKLGSREENTEKQWNYSNLIKRR